MLDAQRGAPIARRGRKRHHLTRERAVGVGAGLLLDDEPGCVLGVAQVDPGGERHDLGRGRGVRERAHFLLDHERAGRAVDLGLQRQGLRCCGAVGAGAGVGLLADRRGDAAHRGAQRIRHRRKYAVGRGACRLLGVERGIERRVRQGPSISLRQVGRNASRGLVVDRRDQRRQVATRPRGQEIDLVLQPLIARQARQGLCRDRLSPQVGLVGDARVD